MPAPTLPKTMRAWTFSSRGLPRDVLTLESSYPVPKDPENTDLLIQVTHVSLNPGSYITMNTIPPLIRRILSGSTTAIAEGEFSGVVHLAGPYAPAIFKPGTRVFGCQPMMKLIAGAGTLAEYFIIPASSVAVTPRGMDLAEASGLSGTGQTAINMFLEIKVKPGNRILVNGGSGGVGTMVVQMAKAKGAYVVATCSGSSAHLVKNLGADEVVDYRVNNPLHSYLTKEYGSSPFDWILDTIGTQDLFTHSPCYLKAEGAVVNVGNFEGPILTVFRAFMNTWLPRPWGIPRRYAMISTTPNGVKAKQLASMVEEGTLRVIVDEIVEFEDLLTAYDRMLNRNAKGKIIVRIQNAN